MAKVKIEVLKPLYGKFKMPHRPGHQISVDSKLAKELIDAKYAKKAEIIDAEKEKAEKEKAEKEKAEKEKAEK